MEPPKNYLIDMDGVLVRGRTLVPGADRFIERLKARGAEYLVLTNNPLYTPGDLAHRLQTAGLDIPTERIFTSAIATAHFLQSQKPNSTAFVIGESGLTEAIHNVGYVITDHTPDYVVLGETHTYNLELITKAIRLVAAGAHFIATNPDPSGPAEGGLVPACGAMAAMNFLGVHSENTVMIGDRMDTDIVAGVESGMETVLVLSGVTHRDEIHRFPYQPGRVLASVAEIDP